MTETSKQILYALAYPLKTKKPYDEGFKEMREFYGTHRQDSQQKSSLQHGE